MAARLEHANLTVPDVDAALRFLTTVEPDARVLHDSGGAGGYRWVHLGLGDTYLAIEEPQKRPGDARMARRYTDLGINHLGLVVDDVEGVAERLRAEGYREGGLSEVHPARIRRYFYDDAGLEWELVEYRTEGQSERFAYS